MLREIRRLYEYHDWANHQVLDAASMLSAAELEVDLAGSFPTFNETLRHIQLVEHLFLCRWQELPPAPRPEWKTIDGLRAAWLSLEMERQSFLSELRETALSQLIHYTDTRGKAVTLELWQALFQCLNHSTFHRGQLMEKLRKLKRVPPATDFVLFCRTHPH